MDNFYPQAKYEVWVYDYNNEPIVVVDDFNFLAYSRAIGSVGRFNLSIDADHPFAPYFKPDCVIHIWRSLSPEISYLEFGGIIDTLRYKDVGGFDRLTIGGGDGLQIIKWRVHPFRTTSAQGVSTGTPDAVGIGIIASSVNNTYSTDRDLLKYGVRTKQSFSTIGSNLTIKKSWKNVLSLVNAVMNVSIQQGNPVFFDIVPKFLGNKATWYAEWGDGFLGVDHSRGSLDPVMFSKEFGNLENAELTEDYSQEINVAYVGGEGEASKRELTEVADDRWKRGPWSRKETFVNFSSQENANAASDIGRSVVAAGKPLIKFTGDVKDTPQTKYGKHWRYGDKVQVSYRERDFAGVISAISVSIDDQGKEEIKSRVEVNLA